MAQLLDIAMYCEFAFAAPDGRKLTLYIAVFPERFAIVIVETTAEFDAGTVYSDPLLFAVGFNCPRILYT